MSEQERPKRIPVTFEYEKTVAFDFGAKTGEFNPSALVIHPDAPPRGDVLPVLSDIANELLRSVAALRADVNLLKTMYATLDKRVTEIEQARHYESLDREDQDYLEAEGGE